MAKIFFKKKGFIFFLTVVAVCVSLFSTLCIASESTNYVENGTFTPGSGGQWGAIPGWTTSITPGTMDLYLGDYNYGSADNLPDGIYLALRKEATPAGDPVSVSQTISNLPAGVYKLSAWMWAANNVETFTITISNGTNEKTISAALSEKGYKDTEIEITSGSATITITADNDVKTAAMDALADDIKLVKLRDIEDTAPNYVENGTFTPGSGGQWGAIPGWTTSITPGTMDLYLGDYNYGSADNLPDGIYLALRKEATPAGDPVSVSQTISNLPAGVYKLSAWMWAANNVETFTITISNGTNEKTISAALSEKGYKDTEIEITSGSATITITADNDVKTAAMDALADDIKLVKIGEMNVRTGDSNAFAISAVIICVCTSLVLISKKNKEWAC